MNHSQLSRLVSWFGAGAACSALGLLGCSSASLDDGVRGEGEQGLMLSGITLQTVLVPRFVAAANNGGGAVNATATVAQGWETFSLEDINGGSLESGDSVFIHAGNGQYFQALNGGGSSLNAGSNNAQAWETFKVVKQSGTGTVNNGDIVGLQTVSGSWVSAQSGGGAAVFAYGGALGSWEQFKINGLPAAAPTPTPTPPSGNPATVNDVNFRTTMTGNFVGASNGGGSTVIATAAAKQAWETFSIIDLNGGSLVSGDSVFVRAGNGQYFQALNGGGSSLNAGSNSTLGWETFKLVKKSGSGTLQTGDVVGLQSSSGSWVSAANGGGSSVFAYGGALGSWESFTIGIGAPAPGPTPPPSGGPGPIDYSIWVLQLPTGSGTSPTTISSSQLGAGFSDAYFYPATDGGQVFMDPATGITTSGSQHCRTEMRESTSGGGEAAWSSSGTNIMTVSGKVLKVGGGSSGTVSVGQLFNGTDSIPLCELQYSSSAGGFKLLYEESKGGGTTSNLNTPVALNTRFTFSLALTKGVLTVTINGKVVHTQTPSASALSKKFYFKYGNYDQTASAGAISTNPYTVIENYSVNVVHQ